MRQETPASGGNQCSGKVLGGTVTEQHQTGWVENEFQEVAALCRRARPHAVLLPVDSDGTPLAPLTAFPCAPCGVQPTVFARMIAESLRWGQPYLSTCPQGHYLWAVPVTRNNALCAGIVAAFDAEGRADPALERAVNAAANELLDAAVRCNLTNAALMRENRQAEEAEASKACAIHVLKDRMYASMREIYLREEEQLHAAVRARDRRAAREVLNRILVGVYAVGTKDLDLLKAMVLEFLVVVYRAAVEAGGDPVAMLGLNYRSYLTLFRIADEEQLSHWLVRHLELLMDCLELEPRRPPEARLQEAVRYVREHCVEDLGRDQVAAAVYLSPTQFSHLLRECMGTTFRDYLNEVRISKAGELLARSEKPLAEIAQAVGFSDQSYFTKVFRKYIGMTPGDYRLAYAPRER